MKRGQDNFKLRSFQSCWGPATKINGRWQQVGGCSLKLAHESLAKAPDLRRISTRLVKCAIRADARAKWKMDVEMANRFGHAGQVSQLAIDRMPMPLAPRTDRKLGNLRHILIKRLEARSMIPQLPLAARIEL